MKEQLWFIFKTFVATILAVLVLQVRIGQSRIEDHVLRMYYTSAIAEPMQNAVDGGVRAIHTGWNSILSLVSLKDKSGKSRLSLLHFERHPKALEKQSEIENNK